MVAHMINFGLTRDNWYFDTSSAPSFPKIDADLECDIAIIGGGFTGLGAALALASGGQNVVLCEASHIGSGASGRNGGQMHTGQRLDPQTLAGLMGEDAAGSLWRMAEAARAHLLGLIASHTIDCELKLGMIHAWHRAKFASEDQKMADYVAKTYGYSDFSFLSRQDTALELGTDVYHGAVLDRGGGHLHPLKLAYGLAKAAHQAGAKIFEQTRIITKTKTARGHVLRLKNGATILCQKLLICGNGYMSGLDETVDQHVLPINNFILTTTPLEDAEGILPNNYAAADSRFVVNYWRKTPDNRLLFGGGENYSPHFPNNIKAFVRGNMLKIYPKLKNVEISHAWGGTLAITLNRAPFVRDLGDGMLVSAGYSGQGVVLAPYFGTVLAKALMGDRRDLELLSRLPVPAFWGGKLLRGLAMRAGLHYYALLDRFG